LMKHTVANPMGVTEVMDSPQHCRNQSAECLRLMQSIQNEAEAQVLRNLSQSWLRLAGQIDRYNALVRDQSRAARTRARLDQESKSTCFS
jgi:hypothetical protein